MVRTLADMHRITTHAELSIDESYCKTRSPPTTVGVLVVFPLLLVLLGNLVCSVQAAAFLVSSAHPLCYVVCQVEYCFADVEPDTMMSFQNRQANMLLLNRFALPNSATVVPSELQQKLICSYMQRFG